MLPLPPATWLTRSFFIVAFLICQFQALETNAQQKTRELHKAIQQNDLALVQKLATKKNINQPDEYGDYPIMNAALYSSIDIMKVLLEKGADPNAKNKDGETALMWSVQDPEKIKLLISYDADVNLVAHSGNTALLIASVGNNQFSTIKYLVDHGADPLAKNKKQETCLMRAALFGDTTTASYLVRSGIEINAKDTIGGTALINAIFNVNRPVTLWLLNNGADPDLRSVFGLTAVSGVVTYNDLPSIKAVLQKTNNVNAIDDGGVSALMWAVYNEHDNPEIISLLLDKGADVHHKAKDGSTALMWAMKKGNTQTVDLLKKAGAR